MMLMSMPVLRKGHRYNRYACPKDRGGCGACGIAGPRLDALVSDAVLDVLDSPELDAATVDAREVTPGNVAPVVELEGRMVELAEMWAEGEISRGDWRSAREVLERRILAARDDLNRGSSAAAAAALAGQGASLREVWDELPLLRRRAIVETVVQRVTIAPTLKRNNKFDPGRVDVEWKA